MKLKKLLLEKSDKYIGGLHQAEVGDYIKIGIEGTRVKHLTKIVKVIPDTNRLVDGDGNIFDRNGVVYRRKDGWAKWYGKGKIVSAKIVTQKEFDEDYKKIKVDFLKSFEWEKLNIKDIEKIIDQLPVKQVNTLSKSRF